MNWTGCRKGSRECVYPEPRPTTKSSSGSKIAQRQTHEHDHQSSSEECEIEDTNKSQKSTRSQPSRSATQVLHSTKTTTNVPTEKQSAQSFEQVQPSVESPDAVKEKSLSPSTDGSSVFSPSNSGPASFLTQEIFSRASPNTSPETVSWSHLPDDLQYYLEYHKNNLTYHHYFFKHRSNRFLHTILFDQALSYRPLLFAVVGFAAFQMSLKKPDGKIEDFLGYYNTSVTLLRKSLAGGQDHSQSTLLTILQLATFEVYLTIRHLETLG